MPDKVTLEFDDPEDAKALLAAIKHRGYIIVPYKHPVHGWRHAGSKKLYPMIDGVSES